MSLARVATLCSLALIAASAYAGPLSPPVGPVASTNRIHLSQASIGAFPYMISAPGTYVLTSHIFGVPGQAGFFINSAGVTLDLNGFTVQGTGGSSTGIFVLGGNATVLNGTVRSWGADGVGGPGGDAVRVEGVQTLFNNGSGINLGERAIVSKCTANDNQVHGISVGDSSTVDSCTAGRNTRNGIQATGSATVRQCGTELNGLHGIQVGNYCTVQASTGHMNGYGPFGAGSGIRGEHGSSVIGCTADRNAGSGVTMISKGLVADSNCTDNANCGIEAGYGSSIQRCVVSDNGSSPERPAGPATLRPGMTTAPSRLTVPGVDEAERGDSDAEFARGIFANDGISTGDGSQVLDCVAQGNGDDGIAGYFGTQIVRCTTRFNGDAGMSLDFGRGHVQDCTNQQGGAVGITVGPRATVKGCSITESAIDGIRADTECVITGNMVNGCGFSGILVFGPRTRVQDNQATFNQTGFTIAAPGVIVMANTASANGINFNFGPGTTFGIIQNYTFGGGPMGPNDPFANFEY